jgi:hypothetical protein
MSDVAFHAGTIQCETAGNRHTAGIAPTVSPHMVREVPASGSVAERDQPRSSNGQDSGLSRRQSEFDPPSGHGDSRLTDEQIALCVGLSFSTDRDGDLMSRFRDDIEAIPRWVVDDFLRPEVMQSYLYVEQGGLFSGNDRHRRSAGQLPEGSILHELYCDWMYDGPRQVSAYYYHVTRHFRKLVRDQSAQTVAARSGARRASYQIKQSAEAADRISELRASGSKLYAIEAGRGGPIKIGVARNPEKRLKELQTGNPHRLNILSVAPDGWMERHMHWRLREARMHGEWFRPTARVRRALGLSGGVA